MLEKFKQKYASYITRLDESGYRFIEAKVRELGDDVFKDYFFKELKVDLKQFQSIDYRYKALVSSMIYVMGVRVDSDIKAIIDEFETIHLNNIAYEQTNPPQVYIKKAKKTTKSSSKTK